MPPKKKKHCYDYPRPSVTVDLVAFTFRECRMHVLAIKRKSPPFVGMYAFPGGFLDMEETPVHAVARETLEETGLEIHGPVCQLAFYGEVDRDPRGRTISLAHTAIIRAPAPDPVGRDDAAEAHWVPLAELKEHRMAFDHHDIFRDACHWFDKLRQLPVTPIALLPERFGEPDVRELLDYLGQPAAETESWFRYAIDRGLCERLPGRKKQYRALIEDATELRRGDLKG